MKIKFVALACSLATVPSVLHAQQPTMPEMPMPATPQPAESAQQPKPVPRPNRSKNPADPIAPDLRNMGQDAGDAKARAAAASVEKSFQQQAGQPQGKPGPDSDAGSLKLPIQELQEPEAIDLRTGGDLPAPELLREVATRTPLTVIDLLSLADRNNPTLAQALRNVDRSREQARQAGLPPDPMIGYSGDHIRGGQYHGGEEGAFFSQEFLLGRKLALRRDVFRAEGRANELAVEIQRARVHNDVAHAFFDTLAAQQAVVVHDRLLKVALDADTNTHELERVGQADASDVLNAEIAAEQEKVEFVTAQRMFLSHFAQLAAYAGQPAMTPQPLTGSLVEPPELDAENLAATDVQNSPAVRQAEANVGVAEARVKSARRENIPNLNVKAGEWYSGEELNSSGLRTGWMSFAEAGVQIPLWNRNQGNVEAARVELDRAHQDVARTQLLTRSRSLPYAQQYQTARFTADRYRTEMLPRARRAYQLEAMKYQQMAQAYPQVLAAQRMLFTLQLTYIRALNEEWSAAIALQNFALSDGKEGLDQPMSVGTDSTMMNLPTAAGSN